MTLLIDLSSTMAPYLDNIKYHIHTLFMEQLQHKRLFNIIVFARSPMKWSKTMGERSVCRVQKHGRIDDYIA